MSLSWGMDKQYAMSIKWKKKKKQNPLLVKITTLKDLK